MNKDRIIENWAYIFESQDSNNIIEEGIFKQAVANIKSLGSAIKSGVKTFGKSVHDTFATNGAVKKLINLVPKDNTDKCKLICKVGDKYYPINSFEKDTSIVQGGLMAFSFDYSKASDKSTNAASSSLSIQDLNKMMKEQGHKKISAEFEGILCVPVNCKEPDKVITTDTKLTSIEKQGDIICFVYGMSQEDQEDDQYIKGLWSESRDSNKVIDTANRNLEETTDTEEIKRENQNAESVHTVEEPSDGTVGTEDSGKQKTTGECESGPVHYAIVANIKNGLFKKDDQVFICHIGSSDQDGNVTTTNRLSEKDGQKMCWGDENLNMEFGGYDPWKDNDWDYIANFAKCGKNEDILKTVKDHYGPRFRNFSIQEFYPEDNDTFVDHIDPTMMKGICPYCR